MAGPIDEALHRTLARAERAGCTPEGHSSIVEGMTQMGDRLMSIDVTMGSMDDKMDQVIAAFDVLSKRSPTIPTASKWIAALGTFVSGIVAGIMSRNSP
ncbi:MAG: hypothetical protein KKF65_07605 [Nanoarchaeota archaeon]|nr:hypothetical protein [Nanoarchaeota archaeon]